MASPGTNVLTSLAVAFIDRQAAGDAVRASIVLTKLSQVWPEVRADFARDFAATGVSTANLPAAIPDIWDGATRAIVASVLPIGSATAQALAQQIGSAQTVRDIRAPATRLLELVPVSNPARQFAGRVAAADVSALPQTLENLISSVLVGSVLDSGAPMGTSRQVFNPSLVTQFRVPSINSRVQSMLSNAGRGSPSADVVQDGGGLLMPETHITGQVGVLGIPTWGWVVGGLVVAGGVGIFVWRRYYA